MGYSVKVNDPYKGVELVRAYLRPEAPGATACRSRSTSGSTWTKARLQKGAGFARLQKNLGELLKAVVDELSD